MATMTQNSEVKLGDSSNANITGSKPNYTGPLILMISLYFIFGFVTVLNDILIPHLKSLFDLQNWQAMLVQSCFFGAYFIMSIPAGKLISKIGYKKGSIVGLGVLAIGLLLFVPASIIISYGFFLFALFVVGSGITILQVIVNPYMGALGRPEKAATRLNLGGSLNSFATTIGPMIGAYFIFVEGSLIERAAAVRIPYIGAAVLACLLAFVFSKVKLPSIIPVQKDNVQKDGTSAWNYSHLVLGALAIFFYVGAEVACGSIIINYFAEPDMGRLGETEASIFVSLYWGGLMVGRFIGIFALQKMKMERTLVVVSAMALFLVLITMFTHGEIAKWSVCAVGLFLSVMWPCIFPLGIRGLGSSTNQGSGIMVAMIVGGAIIPPLQGYLADVIGYHMSFTVVLVCFAYILYYAISGHKVKHPEALKIIAEQK